MHKYHIRSNITSTDEDKISSAPDQPSSSGLKNRLSAAPFNLPLGRIASSMFVLGETSSRRSRSRSPRRSVSRLPQNLPMLSSKVTMGRNSSFKNLTKEDREKSGGIEYGSLRVLLKITVCESAVIRNTGFLVLHTDHVESLLHWTSPLWRHLSCSVDSKRSCQVSGLFAVSRSG